MRPGDPYPYQHGTNPFLPLLKRWHSRMPGTTASTPTAMAEFDRTFRLGTTSVEAADEKGWAVSVTPSGGWVPAVIAGHTGIGLSQRMQAFVLEAADNPYNVLAPGKRPRATLTPSLALKDGKPILIFSVQGGDTQDQNLLQFFLNVVEFGMTVQEATEAANITSYQMRDSFGQHESFPGRLTVNTATPPWVRKELKRWATSSSSRSAAQVPSTRSSWTAGTARCGAARATTARTTASAGSTASARGPCLRPLPRSATVTTCTISQGRAAGPALAPL